MTDVYTACIRVWITSGVAGDLGSSEHDWLGMVAHWPV